MPPGVAKDIIILPYNNAEAVRRLSETWTNTATATAGVTTSPRFSWSPSSATSASWSRCRAFWKPCTKRPEAGRADDLREVITAFRFQYGAAQDMLGFRPDITVLGKIIGGGLPIGAYGGTGAHYGSRVASGSRLPIGHVFRQPPVLGGRAACLQTLQEPGLYERLTAYGERWPTGCERRRPATASRRR